MSGFFELFSEIDEDDGVPIFRPAFIAVDHIESVTRTDFMERYAVTMSSGETYVISAEEYCRLMDIVEIVSGASFGEGDRT